MRAVQLLAFAVVAAAGAVPCLGQSLESKDGVNVAIEKFSAVARVDEGVALVEVDETFRNSENVQREGVWRFRLPADAVVSSFSMWMNGVEKTGRVLEATQARRVYDSIVRTRKDPGLLEQTGWRDFQVSVFPIPANDTVRIRLRYAFVLPDDLGLETLEVPLPVGCGKIGDLRVHATFAAARGLATLDCPSHAGAKVTCESGHGEASWSGDGVTPTGPFVVRAVPKRDGFDVVVVATRAPEGGDGWFVARVVPRLADPPKIPRDVVFVVDRSGSMNGVKMEQARAALRCGLGTLRPGDRFDVVSFSSDVTSLAGEALLPVDAANLARADRAASDLTASGGTNIAGALDTALRLRGNDPSRLFAVVFLTDGEPTVGEIQPDRILAAWRAGSAGAARLFAFGVGADVRDFLLTKLATEGRGAATYVRSDSDLEVKLSSLVDAIRTPLLVDPEVSIDGDGVQVLDREPARLPDVFQGRALVISGRFRGAGKATLHLRGRSGAAPVDVAVPLDFATTADRPHVAQIWAKQRVERLLDDLRANGANAEIRAEIVQLGTRFQIVSPYTSFLVVEDGVRIPDAGEDARVPDQPGGPTSPGGGGGPRTGGGGGAPRTGGGSSGGFGKAKGGGGPTDNREPTDPPPPPAESREPSDPVPPPEDGGPSTPGGDNPSGPATGGPSSGSSGARDRKSPRPPGYENWTYWWQTAWRDELAPSSATPRVAADAGTLTLLRSLLRDENASFHIRGRAALALAAMDDAESVPDLLRLAANAEGKQHRNVRERAVLALGLLRRPTHEAFRFLIATLRDPVRNGDFVRAYAAISLGMLRGDAADDAAAASALRDVGFALAHSDPDPNVQPACLVALGLRADAAAISGLIRAAASAGDSRDVHAVEALGLAGRATPEVLDVLLACIDRRPRFGANARRAASGALARIATNAMPDAQRSIVTKLAAALADDEDTTVRGRAAVALGRIAGDPNTADAARRDALAALRRELDSNPPGTDRSYAAIALGLALHAEPCGVGTKQADEIRARLRAALAVAAADPDARRAPALALGLARDPSAAPPLDAAVGIEHADEAARLVAALVDRDAQNRTLRAAAHALGVRGDAATVAALRTIAADTKLEHSDLTRAYAVLAIGRICGDFGPLDRVASGLELRAYVPALAEILLGQ